MRKAVVTLIALALVVLTMAYRVLAMGGSLGGFENDQFVTLSQAQQMAMGDWPVRDFVSLGKPLTILLSALAQLTLGPTLFSEALLTTAIIGVCTAIMFVLAWRASGRFSRARATALSSAGGTPGRSVAIGLGACLRTARTTSVADPPSKGGRPVTIS